MHRPHVRVIKNVPHMQNTKKNRMELLDDAPPSVNLPPEWQAIKPHMWVKSYAKSEAIIHHGDPAHALWFVLKGWVKLLRQTPDGKESIVGLCTEGDIFGEAVLFKHANYPYNAEATGGEAELGFITAENLRALMQENEELASVLMAMMNQRINQAQLKLEQVSTMSASQRLGCFLLRLCHTQGQGSKSLQIPIEKNTLASYLSMKPETFSRSLQQLKPVGVETAGNTITIGDIEKLHEFVCSSCSESGFCDAEEN